MNEKKNEGKRELILDAAFALFFENGYQNTKIIDIAEKAGIGKGTVYEYFRSKAEILRDLLVNRICLECDAAYRVIDKNAPAKERLLAVIRYQNDFLRKYGKYGSQLKQSLLQQLMESDVDTAREIGAAVFHILQLEYQVVLEILEDGLARKELRPGINLHLATHLTMGLINGYSSSANLDMADFLGFPYLDNAAKSALAGVPPEDMLDLLFCGIGENQACPQSN